MSDKYRPDEDGVIQIGKTMSPEQARQEEELGQRQNQWTVNNSAAASGAVEVQSIGKAIVYNEEVFCSNGWRFTPANVPSDDGAGTATPVIIITSDKQHRERPDGPITGANFKIQYLSLLYGGSGTKHYKAGQTFLNHFIENTLAVNEIEVNKKNYMWLFNAMQHMAQTMMDSYLSGMKAAGKVNYVNPMSEANLETREKGVDILGPSIVS